MAFTITINEKKELRQKMTENEKMIQKDFSENYTTTYTKEM